MLWDGGKAQSFSKTILTQFMLIFPYFLQGLGLGFSSAVTPGSFQAYLLNQASQRGFWRSLPLSLVPLCSDGPIILLILFVLTRTPEWFIILLRLAGGIFLLYLAFGILKLLNKPGVFTAPTPSTNRSSFLKGVLMNLLNPNPYLFWSIVGGPLLMQGWANSPLFTAGFLAFFYLALIGGNAALTWVFSLAHRLNQRFILILNAISALALFAIGLSQIYYGAVGILVTWG